MIDIKMQQVIVESDLLPPLEKAFWKGWLAAKENLNDEKILEILKKDYPKVYPE